MIACFTLLTGYLFSLLFRQRKATHLNAYPVEPPPPSPDMLHDEPRPPQPDVPQEDSPPHLPDMPQDKPAAD
jgi:hypothetical protein